MITRPLAWLFVIICSVLVPLGVVSSWAATMLDDTDTYVDTVEPLATDAAVTTTMASELSDAALRAIGAPGNNRPQVQQQVRAAAAAAIASPEFPTVWREANRVVHREAVKLLSGDTLPAGETIEIDLSPLASQLTQQLANRGLRVDLSGADLTAQLAAPEELEEARTGWRATQAAGYWLPIGAVVLIVFTLVIAPGRLATVGHLAAGIALTLVMTRAALSVATSVVHDNMNDAGAAIWDAITDSLGDTLVIGIIVALVVLAVRIAIGLGRRVRPDAA
ncbi:hypothetical protein [Nocardioides alcanivorans]|uniref:hypothetical protein n=1 Tax=Nocardioides alcanivorans TaxID=2897352 RepID=UPI001F26A9CC|nr:hypothetical protein [Nocardioides alcanivorans]